MIRNLTLNSYIKYIPKNILKFLHSLTPINTADLILDYNNACEGNDILQSRPRNYYAVTLSWIRHWYCPSEVFTWTWIKNWLTLDVVDKYWVILSWKRILFINAVINIQFTSDKNQQLSLGLKLHYCFTRASWKPNKITNIMFNISEIYSRKYIKWQWTLPTK